MKALVINSGSSSLKYKLIDMAGERVLAEGLIERIGQEESRVRQVHYPPGRQAPRRSLDRRPLADHDRAMALIIEFLVSRPQGVIADPAEIGVIGHRVVHGGEDFRQPVLIDRRVIEVIEANSHLAPLHNPAGLAGIRTALAAFPRVPQVAVFDTAFHQTISPPVFLYALPYAFYREHGIRRYGFHGTSHRFVTHQAAALLGKPVSGVNLITLHLGNGSSVTAVRAGRSVDTSMGLTPLDGVVMGTRCGSIDPSIPAFLLERCGMSLEEMNRALSHQSGLKGICGLSDLRDLHARMDQGDRRARLAWEMLIHSYRRYLGAYLVVLGRVDAVVFTAGIGENDWQVRREVCRDLEGLGIELDQERNQELVGGAAGEVSRSSSPVKVLVVPTDEELEIARQAVSVVEGGSGQEGGELKKRGGTG